MREVLYHDPGFRLGDPCWVAFDPGINRTGYCIWDPASSRPASVGALICGSGNDIATKLTMLTELVKELFLDFKPNRSVIEQFVSYMPKEKARSLLSCGSAQGLLFGLCAGLGMSPQFYCKGNISKDYAIMVAKQFGITTESKKTDEIDAVFIAYMTWGKGS